MTAWTGVPGEVAAASNRRAQVVPAIASRQKSLPFVPFGWSELVGASSGGWAAAVYLGLLPSALGFVLWGYAVGRLPV
ncbi:MAG TPA: hypothetical protein VGC18_11775, partial [Lacisediminihabitans sp.]